MDLHVKTQILGVIVCIKLNGKGIAVYILISLHGKGGKRDQIDTVAVLQGIQAAISCCDTDDCRNTGKMSAGSPHPHDIMISPLDIHRMILHQRIHDNMGTRTSVINIPYNMQMIDNQPLDQVAQGNDKVRCPPNPDNSMDDLIVIAFLIGNLCLFCDQLFDDISEILRQSLSYLGSGILGSHTLGYLYQPVQCDLIPVFNIVFLLHHKIQLLCRIIDQRGKCFLVPAA